MHFKQPARTALGTETKDCVYVNLSVEMINYTPVSLEEIKAWL